MQQHLTEQTVVYSAKNDTEKSFDYTLPEYLPGISRIVKTCADIEGCKFFSSLAETGCHISLKISIIYTSEYDGRIKSASFREEISIPFRESFDFSGEYTPVPSCSVISAGSVLQSPRKFSAKLVLQAGVTAYSEKQIPIFCVPENSNVCTLKSTKNVLFKNILPETHFEKTEEISIDSTKPGISEIIHSSATVTDTNVSVSDGTLSFDAKAKLRILYEGSDNDEDKGSYSFLNTEISIGDTFASDVIKEGDMPFLYIDIYSAEPSVSLDPYGENRQLSLIIKYSVTGFAYKNRNVEFITDAFMEGSDNDPVFSDFDINTHHTSISKKEHISQTVRTDMRETAEVCACNAKLMSVSIEHSEGRFFAAARCLVHIFGTNLSGELSAIDSPVTLHIPLSTEEVSPSDIIPDVIINISSCSAAIKEGALILDFDIAVDGVLSKHNRHTLVNELDTEHNSKSGKKSCEVIVYYPQKNECLWSIAKRYRANPEKILTVNNIDEKSVSDCRTLIIP